VTSGCPTDPERGLPGRAAELALLDTAVRGWSAGRAQLVEISGEPGIGKSALLDALAGRCAAAGGLVLTGRAAPAAPEPLLLGWTPDAASAPPGQGLDLASAVRLARAGRRVAVCVDDAHRLARAGEADPRRAPSDGAPALGALLAAAAPGPLLVAYALRPRQAGPRLLAWPASAGSGWRTTQVAPGPLPYEAVPAAVPGAAAHRAALLHRAGEGNPLYLRALAALPDADLRALDHIAPDLTALPADVRCGLSRDLAGLPPQAAALAAAAAVLTPPFSPDLLAQVAAAEPDAALRSLAALTAADVLRADPARPGHLRFRHPALRLMARAVTPPGTLRRLHQRAAAAPALAAADPVERAPHLARTARPGDTEAAQLLTAAARTVLDAAPAVAATWSDTARRLLPPAAPLRHRATATLLLSRARAGATSEEPEAEALPALPPATTALLASHLRRAGETARAAAVLSAACPAPAPTRPAAGGPERLSEEPGGAYPPTPSGPPALALLPAAGQKVSAAPGRPPALLRLQAAALDLAAGEWRAAEGLAVDVLADGALRGTAPGAAVLLGAHGTRALARAAAGDLALRDLAAKAAAGAADAAGDRELVDHLDALTRAGWACLLCGDDTAARRLFDRAARSAAATGQDAETPAAALGAACAAVHAGRLDEAVERAAVCEAAGGRLAGAAQAVRAWALLLRDGPAALAAEEPLPCAAGRAAPLGAVAADLSAAVALTGGSGGGSAEAAYGSVLGAVRVAAALAVGMPVPPPAAHELLLSAALRATAPGTSAALLARAADAFRAAGQTATACWLRLLVARGLVASGRLREARTAVAALKADTAGCPAGGYLRRSAADLQRALGARVPRAGGDRRTLSAREREIAELVCRGLTNADIAVRLFISAKTVEAHLTRIFRKAGVRSRAALAGAMASGAALAL
jgi:DNA-binding CsgD family transcriptional regulator